MSNQVFPLTLAGLDIKVTRTPVYSTEVLTTQSGKEQRAAWWSTPRYRYVVTFNFLRQGVNSNEAKTLLDFFDAHKGQFDSFLFNDPYDSVQRRVRFESDDLQLDRILSDTAKGGGQTWEAKTVKLISVK